MANISTTASSGVDMLTTLLSGDDGIEPTKYRISPWAYEYKVNTIYLTMMFLMSATGICGNILVIGAVLVHKKLRVLSNAFIVNLAFADLCVSFFVNTFNIVGMMTKGIFFYDKPILCEMLGSICIISCLCSVWSVAAIATNRYVCICHRIIYPSIYNKRTLPFMIIGLWVMCTLIDLPSFFGWGGHVFDERALFCTYEFLADFSYTIFFSVFLSLLPFALLTYAYIRILMFSRATKKALKNVQKNADVPVGMAIKTTDMRLLKSILTIWIVFGILWVPYSLVALFDFEAKWPRWIYIFSIAIAHLSSSTNSIIYAVTNKNFREGYAQFLRLIFCCGRAPTKKSAGMNSSSGGTGLSDISQNVTGSANSLATKKQSMNTVE
ncbi:melatonin receptor type 1B-B-like [Amphiura filiformis]|uniref:melatonin receptor type 1B-B-like n=1 Tax=Amphiura filiformis TaxID=82378 RepID=UPI003B20E971